MHPPVRFRRRIITNHQPKIARLSAVRQSKAADSQPLKEPCRHGTALFSYSSLMDFRSAISLA
ncbi:MAG: hypothetical protein PUC29_00640 [Clostridia bacterium]|nr:hypothetical protein [Clostridia bacterium]